MTNKDSKSIESPYLAKRILEVEEIDISYLANLALSSRLHAERLSEKGRSVDATRVRSSYDTDIRSFGLSPSILRKRVGNSLDYEEVRKTISDYVDELKQAAQLRLSG